MAELLGDRSRKALRIVALALAAALGVLALRAPGLLERAEHWLYDGYHRAERPRSLDPRILMIAVTEADIRERGWPLEDGDLATLLRRLREAGAAAIGIDIYRDLPVGDGRDDLEAELRATPQAVVVWHEGAGGSRSVPPPPALEDTDQIGFNDVTLDPDETVRRALLFMDDGERVYTSFPFRLAERYLASRGIRPAPDPDDPATLRLGPTTVAPLESRDGGYRGVDAAGYQILLDYRGAPSVFEHVTLSRFRAGGAGTPDVRGRVVLVGLAADSTNDFFELPFLPGGEADVRNAGVAVHAHAVSQLVRYGLGESRPLRFASEAQEIGLLILAGLLAGAVVAALRSTPSLVGVTLAGPVLALIGGWLAFRAGWWLPVTAPALAWLGSAGLVTAHTSVRERRERAELMQLFAHQVSRDVAEEIWRQRQVLLEGGRLRSRRVEATVLFVDMKGSTAQAARLEPEVFMRWTDRFLGRMAHAVIERGGFVDDYFGDGMKAVFGVLPPASAGDDPEAIRTQARLAVQAALEMERSLLSLNRQWREQGLPAVAMRIGILTGPVVAGLLGDRERLKYTAVGEVVVAAQRLEALETAHDFESRPCRILIGERTRALLAPGISVETLGEFTLRGLTDPVRVHRVDGVDG